jgi:exodeoxyribonuclease VII small subunit
VNPETGSQQAGTPRADAGAELPGSIRDFETAIAELEKIVKQLEDGDMPLDKSLALFERGVELSRYCHDQLGTAQRRIELLTERGDLKDASDLVDPNE